MHTEAALPPSAGRESVPANPLKLPVYLDYHATTPLDPRVLEVMLPYFEAKFGNPASRSHAYGWEACRAVELARHQVAALIGAEPEEIIFTSGATESDNLAIKGVAEARRESGRHLVTVLTEHKAVLDTCKHLESCGFEVTFLPVGRDGRIDLDQFCSSLRRDTILVTIMAANNETGVLHPLEDVMLLCQRYGALLHVDAVQAAGRVPVSLAALGADSMALSAHKMGGPKGVGALLLRPGLDLCDREGLPAYLESSKESNVGFYARFGFRVIAEVRMPGEGPTVWLMWRNPA